MIIAIGMTICGLVIIAFVVADSDWWEHRRQRVALLHASRMRREKLRLAAEEKAIGQAYEEGP